MAFVCLIEKIYQKFYILTIESDRKKSYNIKQCIVGNVRKVVTYAGS